MKASTRESNSANISSANSKPAQLYKSVEPYFSLEHSHIVVYSIRLTKCIEQAFVQLIAVYSNYLAMAIVLKLVISKLATIPSIMANCS